MAGNGQRELAEAIIGLRPYTSGSGVRFEMETGNLSGGNLQKIVIARELASRLEALVAASPTRGLDVAAVETVHRYLLDAAESGTAVLLFSEDLDEILALNDRVLVMYEGRLSAVEDREDVEEIGLRMAGETPPGRRRSPSPRRAAAGARAAGRSRRL